jgi:hypothetical protein
MFMGLTLQEWAAVGTIVSPVVSLFALGTVIIAWRQLRQSREGARTNDVNAIYRSLLEQALRFPEFVSPRAEIVNAELKEFDGDPKEFHRYEAFVDLMLTTFDEMQSTKVDPHMRDYMVEWVACHSTYLDSKHFRKNFSTHLSETLRKLVQTGIEFDKTRSARQDRANERNVA